MKSRHWNILIVGMMLAIIEALCVTGCKPPAPPAPATQPSKPLVCVISGLGNPQLHDIAVMIRDSVPQVEVIEFTGRNTYLSDLGAVLRANKDRKKIVLSHSYGGDKVNQVINSGDDIGEVELWLAFDPVPEHIFGKFNVPPKVKRMVAVWADQGILIRADIRYPTVEYRIHGEHSEICHTPEAFDIVDRELSEALK